MSGLSLESVSRLLGLADVPELDPSQLRPTVVFRPLPPGFEDETLREFYGELEAALVRCGARVVPWAQALKPEGRRDGFVLAGGIDAVFDVPKARPIEEHVVRFLEDLRQTQSVGVTRIASDAPSADVPFHEQLQLGLGELTEALCPIVIGVGKDRLSLVNLNLSHAEVPRAALDSLLERSLIPRLASPTRPIPIGSFQRGWFRIEDNDCVVSLRELASGLARTELFPPGAQLRSFLGIARLGPVASRLFEEFTEGRTGVSYGFLAVAAPPVYSGEVPGLDAWDALYPIAGAPDAELRQGSNGRWYARIRDGEGEGIVEIPDVWVYSSRSGAPDKTNLAAKEDIVRVGLVKGRMHCDIAEGLDFAADVRPSFDTGVMLAMALAAALGRCDRFSQPMPIVHFHGYPRATWFERNERFIGQGNPEFGCGTSEASALAFLETCQLLSEKDVELACVIEPGHGSNLIASSVPRLLQRLWNGRNGVGAEAGIELGSRFLPSLRPNHPSACKRNAGAAD